MEGTAERDKEPRKGREGREEQAQDHPGPDPVHPEASKPVAGTTPEDLRRRQERRMRGGHGGEEPHGDEGGRGSG